jgi:hypothetical protein
MAALNDGNSHSSYAIIYADGDGVPVSFPVGNDGLACVTSLRLSLRFWFSENFMFVDEEVYDALSGDLINTIEQPPVCDGDSKHWLLKHGKYKVYGISDSVMAASTELVTPHRSSTGTVRLTPVSRVKIEQGAQVITILSDDSDENSPAVRSPIRSPLIISTPPDSMKRTPTPITHPPCQVGYQKCQSVVDLLKRPWVSKGARNAFRNLNYDTLDIRRVQSLPLAFDGDVLSELPPVDTSALHTLSKSMQGMDKHHDGHAWTKTVISNIKNHMDLTFCTSTCAGHLRCGNQDCEYTTRVHRTSPVNEMEWDGFIPAPFLVGEPAPHGSTLVCKICKHPPVCFANCVARIYYVLGPANMTRACLHLGVHKHLVKVGEDQGIKERMRKLIEEQVDRTPKASNSAIVMEAGKELVGELLIDPKGAPVQKFDLEELLPVLEKCKYMSSPSIKNDVTAFRYIRRFGVMDGIATLRGCSHWAYVQENKFPGQGSDKFQGVCFQDVRGGAWIRGGLGQTNATRRRSGEHVDHVRSRQACLALDHHGLPRL